MSYRIAYSDPAKAGRAALSEAARKALDAGVAAVARDPYGCSSHAVGGDRNRRDAAIGSIAIIRYEVSPSVVTFTVLRVVGL
ncbi:MULTISPECIES: hypothetical protein [Streptomyces]|uniref:Uncharacterized protein n=1 Tax=Streptomyces tsukubensis (strain DSM 42081 / NBRC 108919 / NRRL 18488 / 9993) TaxID=1114943 RepID=I2N3D3_STRT9|nr:MULTISPECIES: hypothetical protein [Streptomyces]AZK95633.1 hypothetical protein B7R87_18540 [Streptomyces tsukubensis]EIF91530.1 hypothetical protein [Streptomyces tsukubensis NRRL18488]MYS68404.1 hypothetical protein [Streptomyces sp. SID5473]QKM68334.1 hypothetical protein STSU_015255 [Streptomyces tsukubensis NRRL18488]TAI43151.1 hypothetical protein EWI31_15020 [Streptomyces tsukubensis]